MRDVTVLVTVKNARNTIKKCVDSLLREGYKKKEIWIVDGGSDDGTYEILKEYEKAGKIKLFRVEGSAPVSLNWALKRIRTKYVAMTDADCVVEKNWISELKKAFDEEGVIAAAGYCGTPKELKGLSKVIGEELEWRFKNFPKYISRAPTMNLMFLTKFGKKVMFDEELDRAFETDFGYRLTKYGKMKYVPEAKVYHYHRATWTSFFKQQIGYGAYAVLVYCKHKEKARGDHISRGGMISEPFLLLFSLVGLPVDHVFLLPLLALHLLYLKRYVKVKPSSPAHFLLFSYLRSLAWLIALPLGVLKLIRSRIVKNA
ncbi:MAG TPA: glycosyltransferase [Candidatus Aenigmarchaeota archaeon]|nr:glycosyltransferase [Candidatus Aenigmarchaeota archaeon]